MTIFEFSQEFSDEQSCINRLRQIRENEGIICKHCGGLLHRWLENRQCWECTNCHARQTLKSGTVMENTNLSLLAWFRAIALFVNTKKSISAKELQRQLGLKRYQPAWELSHKIRKAMGKRDENYQLAGSMEVDEGFFKTCEHPKNYENRNHEITKETPVEQLTKRGRGSDEQSAVLIMVESTPVDKPAKGQKSNKIGYIKMKFLSRQDSKTITPILMESIKMESDILTDGYPAYNKINEHFQEHRVTVIKDKNLLNEHFPWVHTIISNVKRLFLGIHHKIGKGYLQLYLNEFCYKFNRRHLHKGMFDRLLVACVSSKHESLYTMRSCG
jgi:transposase-like protein